MTPTAPVSILPSLTPEEERHSLAVTAVVREAVAAEGGWLAFDDYLRIVLYAPGLGYYSAGSEKIGAHGDFVTAPELSALFGRGMARQCAEVLQQCGGTVLELGAGTGALAAAILPALEELRALPAHYDILEISADLRARQRERLGALPQNLLERVRWIDALPEVPITGVMLANEVADALPFHRFVIDPSGIRELGIATSPDGRLVEADRPASAALGAEVERIGAQILAAQALHADGVGGGDAGLAQPWPAGYHSELCLMLGPWVSAMAGSLARGAIVIADYGLARGEYYHRERSSGTLRCHFRHRAHSDPLLYPGLQDISAWVDFTRLAEAASDAQLEVAGYCTQAAFLLGTGIESDLAAAGSALEQARLASQARRLLLPEEMGETFKAMTLTRGIETPLRGGAVQDLRWRL